MKIKKLICALMCALMLIAAVVPAQADGRWVVMDNHSHNINSIGVHAYYVASIAGKNMTADITLTYLPDPSNNLPSDDYTTRVRFTYADVDGIGENVLKSYQTGMTGHFTHTTITNKELGSCRFKFIVNGTEYWDKTLTH